MNLFMVGQFRAESAEGIVWDFQGVFDTYEKARAACRNERYCVTPITLNQEFPDEAMEAEGTHYPVPQQELPA